MTSWTKPTADQVDRATALLSQPQLTRNFFEGLKNPEWLGPLEKRGYFAHPPSASRDKERGTVGYGPWPASEYLARMAREAPAVVAKIILAIPKTDNFRVHENFVEAAMLMPPEIAETIAAKELEWLKEEELLFTFFPERLGDLCRHLAAGGKTETALSLFSAATELYPNARRKGNRKVMAREVAPRFDVWRFDEFLNKSLPELTPLLGVSLVELMSDRLDEYNQAAYKENAANGRDHSYIGRPAIEDHSQNSDGRLESILIAGVRDTAEFFLQANPLSLGEVLQVVESHNWTVFKRISIHLVRKFAPPKSAELSRYFANHALFDEIGVRHEYALLLGERIGDVTEAIVDTVFGWIDSGPEEDENSEKLPRDAEHAKWRDAWRRERLAWLEDRLPEKWRAHFCDLLKRCPAPEHPTFPFHISGGWIGPESPKSAEELKTMTVSDLVKFLKAWQPPAKEFMEASREGLGRILSDRIKSDPTIYAEKALEFTGVDPSYVRSIVQGFESAIREHREFPINSVLSLCEWAVRQKREIEGARRRGEDPHWGWTRKAIASFLMFVLQENIAALEQREQIWKILAPITTDPDPTPADEAPEAAENSMGPETLSINTARGQSIHSVIQYALWVRRQNDKTPDAASKIERGLDEMPEVRAVLDDHLKLEIDPSPAIRSVYGQWFPWLFLIDPVWAKAAVPLIFPTAVKADRCATAAWLTYLTFCQPYDSVLEVLGEQYSLAIEGLGDDSPTNRRYRDPEQSLGKHLVSFYWRGKLDLGPESLLVRYLTRADDETRADAIQFVGHSLQQTKEPAPKLVLERIMALWDWLTDSGPLARTVGPETAAAFGWWFSSGLLPDEWSIPRLLKSVSLAKKIEPEHSVANRLITTAAAWPLESMGVFTVLAKNDKEGWGIMHWENQAMTVLASAYQSPSLKIRKAAHELINYLGSRGYERFGAILTKT